MECNRVFSFNKEIIVKFEDDEFDFLSNETLDGSEKPTLTEVKREINEIFMNTETPIIKLEDNLDISLTAPSTEVSNEYEQPTQNQVKIENDENWRKLTTTDDDCSLSYSLNGYTIDSKLPTPCEVNLQDVSSVNKGGLNFEQTDSFQQKEPVRECQKPMLKELKIVIEKIPFRKELKVQIGNDYPTLSQESLGSINFLLLSDGKTGIPETDCDLSDISTSKQDAGVSNTDDPMFVLFDDHESCRLGELEELSCARKKDLAYACYICKRRFVDEADLNKHLKLCRKALTKPTETTTYDRGATKVSISERIKTKNRTAYKCDKCAESFYLKSNLESHHCRTKTFKCEICRKEVNAKISLHAHEWKHRKKEDDKGCAIHQGSEKIYLSNRLKANSFNNGNSDNIFNKANIDSQTKPAFHEKRYSKPDKYRTFGNHYTQESCRSTRRRQLKCGNCGKIFTQTKTLKSHSCMHTSQKLFKCGDCGKMFSGSKSLKNHCYVHTGEKPFVCSKCGKAFRKNVILKAHQQTHSDHKLFKCNICNKEFTVKCSLLRHRLVHTGERPYKCTVCEKRFARPGTLQQHSYIHTGERPHKCKICGKGFTQRGSLQRHIRVHTDLERENIIS